MRRIASVGVRDGMSLVKVQTALPAGPRWASKFPGKKLGRRGRRTPRDAGSWAPTLVGHEDGQLCTLQNVSGGSPKDQLPNAALGVGALHQKIGPQRARLRQDGRTRRASLVLVGQGRCRNT